MSPALDPSQPVHASAVSYQDKGVLILGPSGSGKSALALSLLALGAVLVADDRVILEKQGDTIRLCAPPSLPPLIEARGMGLLRADLAMPCNLALVVDLAEVETQRLPPIRHITISGLSIPLVHKVESAHFAPAILQYLRGGGRHS